MAIINPNRRNKPYSALQPTNGRVRQIGFVIKRHHFAHMLAHHPLQLDSTNPFWSTDPGRAFLFESAAGAAVTRDRVDRSAGVFAVYAEVDRDGISQRHEFRQILSINGIPEPDAPPIPAVVDASAAD